MGAMRRESEAPRKTQDAHDGRFGVSQHVLLGFVLRDGSGSRIEAISGLT
jgi:hypothetical protein